MREDTEAGKAGERAGVGHRWTPEEARAAAEKSRLSPRTGKRGKTLDKLAELGARDAIRWARRVLRDPRASKGDEHKAVDTLARLGVRRVPALEVSARLELTPEEETRAREWWERLWELDPELARQMALGSPAREGPPALPAGDESSGGDGGGDGAGG